jgi:hypothetical protein
MRESIPSATDVPPPLSSRERYISLAEVIFGSLLVIGHNIFHVVPNEVPFLFLLFWISTLVRKGRWNAAGLQRPPSWLKTFWLALAAAVVLLAGSQLVIQPLASHFWPAPENISSVLKIPVHDWKVALRSLAIVWIFAGFGEELGYRGYLLPRAAELGNRSKLAYIAAMFYVAVLFGLAHFYKGPAGVMDSTYSGLVLGGVYLFSGRNLWAPILAHGVVDTAAVVAIFMGWAN